MIRCIPKGLFSWTFHLEGEGHHASMAFDWLKEEGDIAADGAPMEVRKSGAFSGHRNQEPDGTVEPESRGRHQALLQD